MLSMRPAEKTASEEPSRSAGTRPIRGVLEHNHAPTTEEMKATLENFFKEQKTATLA